MTPGQICWRDKTPYAPQFDDIYFSTQAGIDESQYVFLQGNQLPQRWAQRRHFSIGETGFGSGLNFLVTLAAWEHDPQRPQRLDMISIEGYPLSRDDLAQIHAHWPQLASQSQALRDAYPPLVPGQHRLLFANGQVSLTLIFAELQHALPQLSTPLDAWYLDGFAPAKNPSMWTPELYKTLARCSHSHTSLSTFTAARQVFDGLQQVGFNVRKSPGFGRKRHMIQATFNSWRPYRDPQPWLTPPQVTEPPKQVAILGAGIAGLSTAYSLCQRGISVVVLDQHTQLAQGASGNRQGLLLPRISHDWHPVSQFYASAHLYVWRQIQALQQAGHEIIGQFDGCAQSPLNPKKHQRLLTCAEQVTDDFMQIMSAEQLSQQLDQACPRSGVWFPYGGWLNPASLCHAYQAACGDRLTLQLGQPVADLQYAQGQWHALDHNGQRLLSTSTWVLAQGHLAQQLTPSRWLPLQGIRGQVSHLPQTAQSQTLAAGLSYGGYIAPAWQGLHCVGATFSPERADSELDPLEHQHNLDQLPPELSELGDSAITTQLAGRVAFRCSSPDRVPVVGALPQPEAFLQTFAHLSRGKPSGPLAQAPYYPGLYISSAHGARGLTSAPLAGELLADLILGQALGQPPQVMQRLSPARFLIRQLKQG